MSGEDSFLEEQYEDQQSMSFTDDPLEDETPETCGFCGHVIVDDQCMCDEENRAYDRYKDDKAVAEYEEAHRAR